MVCINESRTSCGQCKIIEMKKSKKYSKELPKRSIYHRNFKRFRIRLAFLLLPLLLNIRVAKACEACNQRQPKLLQGITHGSGPESWWDYVVVVFMLMVTVYSFYATVKCLMRPNEKKYKNIKNFILTEQ